MDLKRIFIKDACPTKVGGQAVLEGIMMKGEDRSAVVVRLPDSSMYIKTEKTKKRSKAAKIPLIRGAIIFILSLLEGMRTLIFSAEILEKFEEAEWENKENSEDVSKSRFELWLEKKIGADKIFNLMIYISVLISIAFVVGIFIILPTAVTSIFKSLSDNEIVLNLLEGTFRIILFVLYVVAISRMKDIQTVFKYHGAEHQCIHCFENKLELTPKNCMTFETLHPRCGTSFLMFVMVISLLLFSLLGWPNLLIRILSRLLLLPLIAGISYELLKWAGSSDSTPVKILSIPGILLQKLTTLRPEEDQLEVAIAAMKAVLVDEEAPVYEGLCDKEGRLIDEHDHKRDSQYS